MMHNPPHRLGLAAALLAGALAAAQAGSALPFRLTSSTFANNQAMPAATGCAGENVSPLLHWQGLPAGTRSLALLVRDPDAPSGSFVHWVLYDLPATVSELPAGRYATPRFPLGGLQGTNDFGNLGYGGPCPPSGRPHHYVFTLYALRAPSIGLGAGARDDEVEAAMQGKIVAQTELIGLYGR